MTEEKKKTVIGDGEVEVPIRMQMRPGLPSLTAQHMVANDVGDFVQLSFFEILYPLIPSNIKADEVPSVIKNGVAAECVAKVNVPKSAFPGFAKALQDLVKKSKQIKDT